jgi:DNA-binding response OmpR family regulator
VYSELATVLVVDDEPSVSDMLCEDLSELRYKCIKASTGEEALRKLSTDNFDAILLDLKLPGISGMDVLKEVKINQPETRVIVVTAARDAQTAVEAMKVGAVDYITKPFELKRINSSIEAALDKLVLRNHETTRRIDSAQRRVDEPDWMAILDSIARGVEIRVQSETRHAMMVIERTTAIAIEISVPEEHIARWAEEKHRKITKEMECMSSLLRKLEANPLAQAILGMSDLHGYEQKEHHQN